MRGYIEIKEDAYEDTIEHLYRLKSLACKMIKKLQEYSELYDVLAQGYIPNGRGTQKITVDTTSLQEFNLIYDSFD